MLEESGIGGCELEALRKHVLYIGGGTCSGKSTLACDLARTICAESFSADDRLGEYANLAAAEGSGFVRDFEEENLEWFWMRDPHEQFDEMLGFYRDVFPYVMADLAERVLRKTREMGERQESSPTLPLFVAEGVAFLPGLLIAMGIPSRNCMFLVAGKTEHDQRYAQRDWVTLMLEGCEDPHGAFARWMLRDELFGGYVKDQCSDLGLRCIDTSDLKVFGSLVSDVGKELSEIPL